MGPARLGPANQAQVLLGPGPIWAQVLLGPRSHGLLPDPFGPSLSGAGHEPMSPGPMGQALCSEDDGPFAHGSFTWIREALGLDTWRPGPIGMGPLHVAVSILYPGKEICIQGVPGK